MTDRQKRTLFGVLLLTFILLGTLMLYLGHTQENEAASAVSYAQRL